MLAFSFIPQQIDNVPLFLILGGFAVMLFGAAKAGFGGGIGLLSVPLMIFACNGDAAYANAILLPLLICADWPSLFIWWRKWNWRAVLLLLPGALVGIAIGWAMLWYMQNALATSAGKAHANAALMLVIGLISLTFVGLKVHSVVRGKAIVFDPGWRQGSAIGLAAGVAPTLSHAAGPIVTMAMLPQKMSKQQFVATVTLFFWIANQVKLGPYFQLSMISWDTISAGVVFLPLVGVGTLLGAFLHHRVGEKQFTAIVYSLLGLAGAHFVIGSVRTLAGI